MGWGGFAILNPFQIPLYFSTQSFSWVGLQGRGDSFKEISGSL